jgi:hypothetical protein
MELSILKRSGFLPGLILSLFLLLMTGTANNAVASEAPNLPANSVQIAWHGGYWGGGGYYGRGYYRPGWGYRGGCRCWINRWGNRRCNCY